MLSSLTVEELRGAISTQDVKKVQRVKGIGAKTAQRIVLELADKMGGMGVGVGAQTLGNGQQGVNNTQARDEAMTALTMLGFPKPAVEKLLLSQQWTNTDGSAMTVEEIIKVALRML
jgi:Holliday junction DNA helicase RuvA